MFFWLFGRGRGPRPNSNKKPPKSTNSKKINTPPPLPPSDFQQKTPSRPSSVVWAGGFFILCFWLFGRAGERACFFVAVWVGVACLCFCCLGGPGRGRVFLLLFGRGWRVYVFTVWAGRGEGVFFCCLGGVRVYAFAVWAGGVIIFVAVWAGDGSSVTCRSA